MNTRIYLRNRSRVICYNITLQSCSSNSRKKLLNKIFGGALTTKKNLSS
jgi:hypothetical protein